MWGIFSVLWTADTPFVTSHESFNTAFSFGEKRRKRKSLAKRKAPKERVSLSAESEGAPRPPPRKLLKKFDQNFIQLTKVVT